MMENTLSKLFWLVIAVIVMAIISSCGGGGGGSSGSDEQKDQATLDVVYTFDKLNRLTSANYNNGVVVSYTYDAAGNILSAEFAP